ncbi:MAG: hypothetical protein HC915_09835, partial [Anaerolineae bacterium]|nr:hypothetical protein [Anaerolineae bacterium]
MRERIFGVDFSGSQAAGRKIWIAEGTWRASRLQIGQLYRAADLPSGQAERGPALAALANAIRTSGAAVWGVDFPLGLPQALLPEADWRTWVQAFPLTYPDAEQFRQTCLGRSQGKE